MNGLQLPFPRQPIRAAPTDRRDQHKADDADGRECRIAKDRGKTNSSATMRAPRLTDCRPALALTSYQTASSRSVAATRKPYSRLRGTQRSISGTASTSSNGPSASTSSVYARSASVRQAVAYPAIGSGAASTPDSLRSVGDGQPPESTLWPLIESRGGRAEGRPTQRGPPHEDIGEDGTLRAPVVELEHHAGWDNELNLGAARDCVRASLEWNHFSDRMRPHHTVDLGEAALATVVVDDAKVRATVRRF